MKYSRNPTIDAAARKLIKSGEWFFKSNKCHAKLEHFETHQCITIPDSPSDHRSEKNWFAQLRRLGVNP